MKKLNRLKLIDELKIKIDLLKIEKKDRQKDFLNIIDNLNKEIKDMEYKQTELAMELMQIAFEK
tara:strand:+ start:1091 stop:1282 length:192 start_codon:yes stop_codon:yes gene_type:complete